MSTRSRAQRIRRTASGDHLTKPAKNAKDASAVTSKTSAKLTANILQLARITASLEDVARDDTRRERPMLGVDRGDLLRERRELGERGPDREAAWGMARATRRSDD